MSANSGKLSATFLVEDSNGRIAIVVRPTFLRRCLPAAVMAEAQAVWCFDDASWLKWTSTVGHKEPPSITQYLQERNTYLSGFIPQAQPVTSEAVGPGRMTFTIAYEHSESGFYCGTKFYPEQLKTPVAALEPKQKKSKIIAIVRFKELDDKNRRFEVRRAFYNMCGTSKKNCAFIDTDDCIGSDRYGICTSGDSGFYFKEIPKTKAVK